MSTSAPPQDRLVAGRYRLDRVVGSGGMGVLWAAEDQTLGREVAVKELRLREDLSAEQNAGLRHRALREARAAARVTHPSAVTVYDVVEEDGRPWIVMELLSPRTLADVLAVAGPLTPTATARLGLELLDALVTAHAAGVVHRDVKPGNILFADGRAVLVDFGIATLDDDPAITATGMLLGSPAFMAPERARGEQPTPASDLWSLGATLFTAVEGEPPFRRDGDLPTLAAVVTQDAPPAEHAGPLGPVLAALLAREPADRPGAEQARLLLLAAAEGVAVHAAVWAPDATSALAVLPDHPALVDTVESPLAAPSPLAASSPLTAPAPVRLPRQRPRRVGALAVATLAPVALLALAVRLPMPWQHSAALQNPAVSVHPAASTGTPPTKAPTQPSVSPPRGGSNSSRSTSQPAGSAATSTRGAVDSWRQRSDEVADPGKDKEPGHGDGEGKGHDGDGKDGKDGHGKEKGSGKGGEKD